MTSRDPLLGQDDTTSGLRESPPGTRGRWFRRAGQATLGLIVLAAALGFLGPRQAETSAEAAGYRLDVEFPRVTRAGEPAPLHVTIESDTGFGETLQLRLCNELFDDLDFQNWYPNPSKETSTPAWITYEFDTPPSGNTFQVSLDARSAPGQFGEVDDCGIELLDDDTPLVSTSFNVWRMP